MIPKCSVDGCDNNAMNQGRGRYRERCSSHHKKKYGLLNMTSSKREAYRTFPIADQCSVCGWKGPCDRHRVIMGRDGGDYRYGNVMILCPNCHRLLHLGLLGIG